MTKVEKQKILVTAMRTTGSLYCSTGIVNGYRLAFMRGEGGSRKEETWNEKRHTHSCCGSRVPWRHKVNCKRILEDGKLKNADDYKIKIHDFKTFNL